MFPETYRPGVFHALLILRNDVCSRSSGIRILGERENEREREREREREPKWSTRDSKDSQLQINIEKDKNNQKKYIHSYKDTKRKKEN